MTQRLAEDAFDRHGWGAALSPAADRAGADAPVRARLLAAERAARAQIVAPPCRVLLIEDNRIESELARERLSDRHPGEFAVTWASTLAEADLCWSHAPFDCVVLDLELPDSMGVESLRRVRGALPNVAIVVYSSQGDETVRAMMIAEGAQDYICKNAPEADALDRGIMLALERVRGLKLSREFEGLVAANPDAMIVADAEGRVRFVNRAACALFGRRASDFIGERMGFAVEEGMVSEIDIFCSGERRAGEIHVVHCSWDGQPAQLAAIRDVTEKKVLMAQLQEAQRMELAGQLASGVAHDFGNVLASVGLFTELAMAALPSSDPGVRHLMKTIAAVEVGRDLVRQLLEFSRSRVGSPKVVDIPAFFSDLKSLLLSLLPETITLEFDAPANVWPVRIDPHRLEQVLLNLVMNARDAMPETGTLRIEAMNVMEERAWLRLSVVDDGVGMTEEVLQKLFRPFFTTKGRGTGLGLAMCKTIVAQADGTISVVSREGHGTTFEIRLPAANHAGRVGEADEDRHASAVFLSRTG